MATGVGIQGVRIDQFFGGPRARADKWRDLVELAEVWSTSKEGRGKFDAALSELSTTEEFYAYPGPKLMAALHEHAAANKADAAAVLARRIARALLTRSFRQSADDWDVSEEGDDRPADVLPPALGRAESKRPYFEVLIVTGAPSGRWASLSAEWRRLRRSLDEYIYEPVFVGSFEDAFCAAILNPNLASVVIHEGFPFRSRHDAPILRSIAQTMEQPEGTEGIALRLAQVLKNVRPEL